MMPRERLTEKEIQVAGLVWQGLTNREIGRQVGTTEQVIKNHLRSTFDKLGVWTRLELAMYVASHGGKEWLQDTRPHQGVDSGYGNEAEVQGDFRNGEREANGKKIA